MPTMFIDVFRKTTPTEELCDRRAQTSSRPLVPQSVSQDLPGLFFHASPMRFGSTLQTNL
ncbi:MAG TPA: hypothetical protein VF018_17530 [Acidobacteriaceae bacterium]